MSITAQRPHSMQSTHVITPIRSVLHRDSIYGPSLHIDQQISETSPWIAAWSNSRGAWKSLPEINKDYRKTVEADAKNQSVPSLQTQRFRQKRVSFSTDAPALIDIDSGAAHTTRLIQDSGVEPRAPVYSQPQLGSTILSSDTEAIDNPSIEDRII